MVQIGYECIDELRGVDKQLRLRMDQLESTLGSVCKQYDGVLETKADRDELALHALKVHEC